MQESPVTPLEQLDDALRALGLALERLAEAFQEWTLIVVGVPSDHPKDDEPIEP